MQTWNAGRRLAVVDSDASDLPSQARDGGAAVSAAWGVSGVFTTVRLDRGVPFAWARHLRRLAGSVEALGLPRFDAALLTREVRVAVETVRPKGTSRLRVTWSAVPGSAGVLSLELTPAPSMDGPLVVATSLVRRESSDGAGGHKSVGYVDNMLALRRYEPLLAPLGAPTASPGEVLLLNDVGDVCEGSGSNVFFVIDGEVVTPPLSSGCLPGVVREQILQWGGVSERSMNTAEALGASEMFVTSSLRGVQSVDTWGSRAFDAPSTVTREIAREWSLRSSEPGEFGWAH